MKAEHSPHGPTPSTGSAIIAAGVITKVKIKVGSQPLQQIQPLGSGGVNDSTSGKKSPSYCSCQHVHTTPVENGAGVTWT